MMNQELKSHKYMGLSVIMLQKELKKFILETVKAEIQNNKTQNEFINDLLKTDEVCKTYKISRSTLERYIREGLKFSSTAKGCKRLFKKSDVEKFKKIKNDR